MSATEMKAPSDWEWVDVDRDDYALLRHPETGAKISFRNEPGYYTPREGSTRHGWAYHCDLGPGEYPISSLHLFESRCLEEVAAEAARKVNRELERIASAV